MDQPTRAFRIAILAVALASVLPLVADGLAPNCFNGASSLGSTIRGPTNGDEQFFTLPMGPSNIMFVLDSSGSMKSLPQCGDGTSWGDNNAPDTCQWPLTSVLTYPRSSTGVTGTCDVGADPNLAWMQGYTPQATVFDPGRGLASNGLDDRPTWGSTCTGDACLFQGDKIYSFMGWNETSATPVANCNTTDNGDAVTPSDAECRRCLFGDAATAAKGFYFYSYRTSHGDTGRVVLFSGAWLNANPPKFMAARKVIKDMVWIDPAVSSTLDRVRFGVAILAPVSRDTGTGSARIVVPLGPDKPNTYPAVAAKYVEARQYMIDAMNRKASLGLPSFMSGSTPLATTLFGVGQYFTSANLYTSQFGASYEKSTLAQGVSGLVSAPWATNNANQCSICWGCQQNSVIIVTDGSPNSEATLPSAITGYDQSSYVATRNCSGSSCTSGQTASCPTTTTVRASAVVSNVAALASAVGTLSTVPTSDCRTSNGVTSCRCNSANTDNTTNPRIPNTQRCYTCPNSSTKRYPGYTCGYTCPGQTSPIYSQNNNTCWYQCPGSTTQVAQNTACYTTCPSDSVQHPVGYTCPCSCPGDPNPYTAGQVCPTSQCCSPTDSSVSSSLPRVASWLNGNDLRTDLSVNNPQVIQTYTVSFGLPVPAPPDVNPAVQILKATANMGGGLFNNASDARSLASAVSTAVQDVVERANSFSAPAAASLSTLRSVAVEAVLTRFKPNSSASWEGHVFQGQLFDEFLNGCDPTKAAGAATQPQVTCGGKTISANFDGNADASGKAICTGVFLLDADCDEVVEDVRTGTFFKKGQGVVANMFWDAGFTLSNPVYPTGHAKAGQAVPGYRAADARSIYTVINGARVDLSAANAATLAPYMNLPTAWCTTQLNLWGICGSSPLPACTSVPTQCAKAIIDFVHGWDVTDLDNDGCGAPGRQSNATKCTGGADGEERDRANDARTASPTLWKLGDVFHSAPVIVRPPTDEFSCGTGFDNQCTATIFGPRTFPKQTAFNGTYTGVGGVAADPYEAYRLAKVDRRQIVLVGANDGMLHAFDAGSPDTSQSRNSLGVLPYTKGTGEELWALVPPDLLPRLKDLTQTHQYMVDGHIMVKDVWVDGSTADPAVSRARDNRKEWSSGNEEFHTIAVITERTGGTQYTALDITDVLNPRFLWTFPEPGSDDSRYMGQSWSDFAPGPPPIGPIRMALGAGVPDPTGREFEEQWIVFANGGYDPTLTRGRAVWMLDAWTGRVIWRFTDDDFKSQLNYGAGTSMFPVTGTVGAVDIGDPAQPTLDRDGFFDTATWGDLGGSLFVARFWTPGTPNDGTSRVSNWFAARTFEERRQATNTQRIGGRSPFFLMADNVFDPTTHTLRTFVGSGNRERSMTAGQECSPDNLLGCCTAGCSRVSATYNDTLNTCVRQGSFRCDGGVLQLDPTSSTCAATPACGSYSTTATITFEGCPGTSATVSLVASLLCDASGTCTTPVELGSSAVGTVPAASTKARFYGIWSFGGTATKSFDTPTQTTAAQVLAAAKVFEDNRFTDDTYAAACSGTTGSSCRLVDVTQAVVNFNPASPLLSTTSCASGSVCEATASDPGWYYQYGDRCPLASCDPAPPWYDEKTGAASSTVLGCTSWASFRPVGAAASGSDPCTGTTGTPQTYGYLADYMTGVPTATCGYQNITADPSYLYVRATQRNTIAAPNAQTIRVVVSPAGEVKYQGLEFPPGAGSSGMISQTNYGTRTDTSEMMYWLEVPRELHNCRHNAAAAATTCE